MNQNEDLNKVIPVVDPKLIIQPDLADEIPEGEEPDDVLPEDFEHFNLDAIEKLKKPKKDDK